ncbi:hypothetical protein PCYB_007580, partial [Plasmodium cynomolgi strain B]
YGFYEHIDEYLEYEEFCNVVNNYYTYNKECKSIGSEDDATQERVNICKRFHCLLEKIRKSTSTPSNTTKYAYLAYLSSWLNYELLNKYAEIDAKNLLGLMITVDTDNRLFLNGLRKCMYDMEDNDVKNMNDLYLLYNNYKKMNEIIKSNIPNNITFMEYSNDLADKYNEFEEKCLKETSCSRALFAFKEKHKSIKLKIQELEDWVKKVLPSLSTSANAQENVSSSEMFEPIKIKDEGNIKKME